MHRFTYTSKVRYCQLPLDSQVCICLSIQLSGNLSTQDTNTIALCILNFLYYIQLFTNAYSATLLVYFHLYIIFHFTFQSFC